MAKKSELTIEKFPHCCGIGIMAQLAGLTLDNLKEKILIAKHYGYTIWMRNGEWEDTTVTPINKGLYPIPSNGQSSGHFGWGSLLAVTSPSQNQQIAMLKICGFKPVASAKNPIMHHSPTLWHLDLNTVVDSELEKVTLDPNNI